MENQKLYEVHLTPILKSVEGGDADETKDFIQATIEGIASDGSPDIVNEIVVPEGIDTTYVKHGLARITNDHSKDPADFIGFVDSMTHQGGQTRFRGRIFAKKGTPQYKVAKSVIGDLENIALWNQQYPDNPKTAGFSIEGLSLKKDGKHLKTFVSSVAYTRGPQNPRATMTAFAKSILGADYSNFSGGDPGLQTGASALRPEQINNQTRNAMDKIKTYADAFAYFKSQGKSDDEARKLANEWQADQKKKDQEVNDGAVSALADMEKSILAISDMNGQLTQIAKSIGEINTSTMTSIQKSMNAYRADSDANAGEFVSAMERTGELNGKTAELVAKQTELIGLIGGESAKVYSSLAKSVHALLANSQRQAAQNESMVNMFGQLADLVSRVVAGQPLSPITKSITGPGGNQPSSENAYSKAIEVIANASKEGKVDSNDLAILHYDKTGNSLSPMAKSILAKENITLS
ncbi:MAG: hypothetical protein HUU10_04430 [Bacteroidetes bacterium]|nr:hypothetical protein [Bacteroidota bacterium]